MKTGCWWETCPRDVDATPEQEAFKNVKSDEEAFDLAIRLLDKAYPFGAEILRTAKTIPKCKLPSWYAGHIDRDSFDKFVRLNTEVHELVHCLNHNTGNFVPGLDMGKALYNEEGMYFKWLNEWPQRKEIYSEFGPKMASDGTMRLYFTNSERPGMGDQRLSTMLSETEAYMQGVASGAWLNDGVSSSYSHRPEFNELNIRININIQEGNPKNLATWQCASVLYLKRVKTNYDETWKKMLAGEGKYGDVGRLFLAYYDRFDFLLRLYVDKNKITADVLKETERKELILEARSLTQQNRNVIDDLRMALSS